MKAVRSACGSFPNPNPYRGAGIGMNICSADDLAYRRRLTVPENHNVRRQIYKRLQ